VSKYCYLTGREFSEDGILKSPHTGIEVTLAVRPKTSRSILSTRRELQMRYL
jgi:hypothetical protein